MKNYLLFFLVLGWYFGFAQVFDDFSDGEISHNPVWLGDLSHFIVNDAEQLQLFTEGIGSGMLVTSSSLIDSIEWNLWVKLSFSPSSNNFARIYLASDNQDLYGNLNGYYLQLGESGSGDAIELFKQTGSDIYSICRGAEGAISTSFSLRIRITRNNSGEWKIFVDPSGNNNYSLEASGIDNSVTSTSWFGILCNYTSSNSTKFYFDDIKISNIEIDTTAPEILSVIVVSPNQLDVEFSEQIIVEEATRPLNYQVNNGMGNPVSVFQNNIHFNLFHLFFTDSFQNGRVNILSASGIPDINENMIKPVNIEFSYYLPEAFDIVINEIFADPDPMQGLPPFEFVELYNTTDLPVNLSGWLLQYGSSEKYLPSVVMDPDGYLIITKGNEFTGYGSSIDLFTSSTSLSNLGTTLCLKDQYENIIHTITYSNDWFEDDLKSEGGWSLEMIDPKNPCGESGNWGASINILGGTPGAKNTIHAVNPDLKMPGIYSITIENDTAIMLTFNEKMRFSNLSDPQNFYADNGLGYPVQTIPVIPDYRSVILNFQNKILEKTIYTLEIKDTLSDCSGNILPLTSIVRFAIPSIPEPMDLVINEILTDPFPEGEDFVEIYNRSQKVFDLKHIVLATYDTLTGHLQQTKDIVEKGFLCFPLDYIVLSKNTQFIKNQYITSDPNNFIQMLSFPAYANEEGIIAIARKSDYQIIDILEYSEDLHFDLLNSTEGISLERINYDRSTDDHTNWHSAAETASYATPGYRNSQFNEFPINDNPIVIEPKIFSPDNDGHQDILNILYQMEKPGYVASVIIFDSRGKQVRQLANNTLLEVEGAFTWDGISDRREPALAGIYIVCFKLFNLEGKTRSYKSVCVLAG